MHRSLHSLADILLLGRESGQGGPNLREGGGQSGLNQHFGSYLCKKDTSISSSPPHGSPCQCTQCTCYISPHQRTRIVTRGYGV